MSSCSRICSVTAAGDPAAGDPAAGDPAAGAPAAVTAAGAAAGTTSARRAFGAPAAGDPATAGDAAGAGGAAGAGAAAPAGASGIAGTLAEGGADWTANAGRTVSDSKVVAARLAPANSFDENINPTFNVRFISFMTGESRIPCGSDGLPDSGTSVAGTKHDAEKQAAKSALRKTLRAARGALDPAIKVQWDAHIGAQVMAWWRLRQVDAVGVYWPLAGEPDLRAAYAELAKAGVRLALPVVMERDAALSFVEWTPGEPMLPDQMGILVPATLRFVERPPALLIPCLGFNEDNYRLGYGGGYYDRTLAPVPRPHTLGIAYGNQQAVFSHGPHDLPLDVIVTEATHIT
jgi:5,10-methenyltetrahydrofolate synthetase